jgi:hypothetical protein
MFAAVRGSPSRATGAASVATVSAAAGTVAAEGGRTSYFVAANSVPSAVTPAYF